MISKYNFGLGCFLCLRVLVGTVCGMAGVGSMMLRANEAGPVVAHGTLRSDAVTLVWGKSREAGSDGMYRIYRDRVLMAETVKTHYTVGSLVAGATHTFTVRRLAEEGDEEVIVGDELTVQTPAREPGLDVRAYGAVGDGVTLNTRALQAAIDACPPQGVVRVSSGIYLTGGLCF